MSNKVFEDIKVKQGWLFDGLHKEISTDISPGDGMYKKNQEEYYYMCGLWATQCIRNSLKIANKPVASAHEILDFASGHGRVTRAISAFFPDSNITVCDTDKSGIDFISSQLNARGVYGDTDLSKINFDNKFDLIWCGSLFTHIDANYWGDMLNFLSSNLISGGMLVFTTHGRYVESRLTDRSKLYGLKEEQVSKMLGGYMDCGFGFGCYDYAESYGVSVSRPSWVLTQLEKLENMEVVAFTERGWVKHQDVVALIKSDLPTS